MRRFFSSNRNKWLTVITVIAFAAGITGRNVTPYPRECMPEGPVDVTQLTKSDVH